MFSNLISLKKLKKSPWLQIMVLLVIALSLRFVKANYFPFWNDEIYVVNASNTIKEGINQSASEFMGPVIFVTNALIRNISESPLSQRMPVVLAGSIAIVAFYHFLRQLKYFNPFLLSLIPATSFILIFYSQELRPYSYILLLSLLSFFYGYKLANGEAKSYELLGLGVIFGILPLTHYFLLFHLVALDITILIWLIYLRKKLLWRVLDLLLINSFIIISYIPWLHVIFRVIEDNKQHLGITKMGFWDVSVELFNKITGGGLAWSVFIVIALIILILTTFKLKSEAGEMGPDNKFVTFLTIYLAVFLLGISPFKFFVVFFRYFLHLIWPFFFILFYFVSKSLGSGRNLLRIGSTLVLLLLLASNLINTISYLLAPNRFVDWRSMAQFAERQIEEGKKTKIVLDSPADEGNLRFYLHDKTRTISTYQGTQQSWSEQIECCPEQTVVISNRIQDKIRPVFERSINFEDNYYLNLLIKRHQNPLGESYKPPIVFY